MHPEGGAKRKPCREGTVLIHRAATTTINVDDPVGGVQDESSVLDTSAPFSSNR